MRGSRLSDREHRDGSEGRVWLVAVLLTLVLHAAVVAGLWAAKPGVPVLAPPKAPEPIEFVFAPRAEAAPEPDKDQPRLYTELPSDRADQPPEHPKLLSNVTSRARDEEAGASDGDLPRLTGTSDYPAVQMRPASSARSKPSPPAQAKTESRRQAKAEAATTAGTAAPMDAPPPNPTDARTPNAREDRSITEAARDAAESPVIRKPRPVEDADAKPADAAHAGSPPRTEDDPWKFLSPTAGGDFLQEAMNNPDGGALAAGGISLNTTAWAWAPWLEEFLRNFQRQWTAPYAYYMGTIHGSHVIRLRIAKDGSLMQMDAVEVDGDSVLVETSELTFRALAPYAPLPSDFPEKYLILRMKLVYPEVQRVRRPPEPPPDRRGRRRH
jgi:hypothetical protein